MDIVKQDEENNFQRVHRLATKQNELLAEQKPVTGWGGDVLLSTDPTANAAINYHSSGIIWGLGSVCEGHFSKKRKEDIERMIVWAYDDTKQPYKIDEWLEGRICQDCGQRKDLNDRNFYVDEKCRYGHKTICIECSRYKDRQNYALFKQGNVRKYRRN